MSLSVTTKVGDADVIASGSVVCSLYESVNLYAGPEATAFRIELAFEKVEGQPSKILTQIISQTYVKILFTNFGGSLGTASTTPMVVGTFNKRNLLLLVASYIIGTDPLAVRLVNYTMTLGEPVNE